MAAPIDYEAYYLLKDNADDETGNYNGAISGTVAFNGNALVSDGSGYVYAPAPVVSGYASVTFWVKVTKPYNSTGTVFAYNHSGDEDPLIINFPHWDDNCTFEWGVNGSSGTSSFVIESEWEEKWTHVSFIVNAIELKIYINNNLYQTVAGSFDGYDFSSRYIQFLYGDIDGEKTPGEIARIRIYDYELTTTQISDIYTEEYDDFYTSYKAFSIVAEDIAMIHESFDIVSLDEIPTFETFQIVSVDEVPIFDIFSIVAIDHQGALENFSIVYVNDDFLRWDIFKIISEDKEDMHRSTLIKRINS